MRNACIEQIESERLSQENSRLGIKEIPPFHLARHTFMATGFQLKV